MKHYRAFPLYTSPGCELKRLLALCLRATFLGFFVLRSFLHAGFFCLLRKLLSYYSTCAHSNPHPVPSTLSHTYRLSPGA